MQLDILTKLINDISLLITKINQLHYFPNLDHIHRKQPSSKFWVVSFAKLSILLKFSTYPSPWTFHIWQDFQCYVVWLFVKLGPHIVMVHRNLSRYNLTGPISPSFGNLLSLTSLWVTFMSSIVLDYYNLNWLSFGRLTLLRFIKTWITLQF